MILGNSRQLLVPRIASIRTKIASATSATLLLQFCFSSTALGMKPSPPLNYAPPIASTFNLSAFSVTVGEKEANVQSVYDSSRKLHVALTKGKAALDHSGSQDATTTTTTIAEVDALIQSLIPETASRDPRVANLSHRVEEYVRLQAFQHFLQTGTVLAPSQCVYATDEEYLAGACMGLSQDLSRYAMGRATARDSSSVSLARDLVEQVQHELLQFDFRNGPLRRKFDGTKYALKTLETLLYELSVTGSVVEPEAKRLRKNNDDDDDDDGDDAPALVVPRDEITALRQRMEHRDELRETLIKKSRDGQKAAKNAIFALHRGDKKKAKDLIQLSEKCIQKDLLPIVQEEPPLRGGSFSNVLEEYAEAKLFYAWLFGKDGNGDLPVGDLLEPQDFDVELSPEEYLGGLCDLTGEIGRFAVQRGTARDTDGVKLSLHTNSCILTAIQTMERSPSGINKKMDQLRRSVEKLERILYEMSLSEATGRNVQTSAESMEVEE